jgi:hypothetical protein
MFSLLTVSTEGRKWSSGDFVVKSSEVKKSLILKEVYGAAWSECQSFYLDNSESSGTVFYSISNYDTYAYSPLRARFVRSL